MFYTVRELLNDKYLLKKVGLKKGIKGKTCIVQGFGNVATWFSKFFHDAGGIVKGVVDYNGSVWKESGLDINALIAWQEKTGSPKGFPGATTYDDDRVLYRKCDVHAPSAMEQQIHIGNVHKIQTKVIVEGANGPITPNAHKVLVKSGVMIIPDMLANSGGVTVSYFEWLKNLSHVEMGMLNRRWEHQSNRAILDIVQRAIGKKLKLGNNLKGASELEIVYTALDEMMSTSFREIADLARERDVCLRTAAYIRSVENIHRTEKTSGNMF